MENRSKTEIVAMILNTANGGETKTKIMYFAFLSYTLTNISYLSKFLSISYIIYKTRLFNVYEYINHLN